MHPNTFLYQKIKCINGGIRNSGKTKVRFMEAKIAPPNIYHVYLRIETPKIIHISEKGKDFDVHITSSEQNEYKLPDTEKSIEEILQLEHKYNKESYIFGFNDCRHYCNKMLNAIYELNDEECKDVTN